MDGKTGVSWLLYGCMDAGAWVLTGGTWQLRSLRKWQDVPHMYSHVSFLSPFYGIQEHNSQLLPVVEVMVSLEGWSILQCHDAFSCTGVIGKVLYKGGSCPPRPLTSRGTSAWPYRVTTQYSYFIYIYVATCLPISPFRSKNNSGPRTQKYNRHYFLEFRVKIAK